MPHTEPPSTAPQSSFWMYANPTPGFDFLGGPLSSLWRTIYILWIFVWHRKQQHQLLRLDLYTYLAYCISKNAFFEWFEWDKSPSKTLRLCWNSRKLMKFGQAGFYQNVGVQIEHIFWPWYSLQVAVKKNAFGVLIANLFPNASSTRSVLLALSDIIFQDVLQHIFCKRLEWFPVKYVDPQETKGKYSLCDWGCTM